MGIHRHKLDEMGARLFLYKYIKLAEKKTFDYDLKQFHRHLFCV